MTLTAKEKSFIGQTVTLRCVEILDHKAAISKDFDVGQDYLAVAFKWAGDGISFRVKGKSKNLTYSWGFNQPAAEKIKFKVRQSLVKKDGE